MTKNDMQYQRNPGSLRRALLFWVPIVSGAISLLLLATDLVSFPFRIADFAEQADVAGLTAKAAACRTDAYPHVMLDEKDKARAAFKCMHEALASAIAQGDTSAFVTFASIYGDHAFGDTVAKLTPADSMRAASKAWCDARRKGVAEAMTDPPFAGFEC